MRQMRNEKNGVGREADWTREFRVGQSALIFLIFSFYLDNKKWVPISTQICSCDYRPSDLEIFLQDVK